MKIIYRSVLAVVCVSGCFSLSIQAQTATKDTTLNRQVSVEREYTPVIQDAFKINTMPAIEESAKPNTNVPYVTDIPQVELSAYPIKDMGSGDAATGIDFSKKRGYFIFGVGHNINLDGRLGYRVVDADNDRLDIFASHNSANSDVDYLDQGYLFKSIKAKYSDSYLKAKYQHSFEPSVLYLNASYLNSMYNYYGNSFFNSSLSIPYPYSDKQQNVNVFGGEAGIKSKELDDISYFADFKFHHFTNKYGPYEESKGTNGNMIEGSAGVGTTFDSDKKVDIGFGFFNQSYGKILFSDFAPEAFHDLSVLKADAHFGFEGGSWNVLLGAKLNYAIDVKNKFVIAPDIRASIRFADRNSVYAIVTGGINENNFLQTLLENRYANPATRVGYSSTLYDATLGFRIGALDGFEFDIFGKYKYTKDDHLYLYGSGNTAYRSWGNYSASAYANVGEGSVGGQIKTQLIPYTDLTLRAQAYHYDVKYVNDRYDEDNTALLADKKKAWGKPAFTVDLNADVKPVDKLLLTLNYIYKGGRKTYFRDQTVNMKDVNELNFRGEYQFLDWLSANLTFNNLLNQKYETFYGYTHQGFNVMGGLSLKF